MTALVIGIPACTKHVNGEPQHAVQARFGDALAATIGALPIYLPPHGPHVTALLDRIDGLLLSGSPSNVHPTLYGEPTSLTPDSHDPARDETTLPLIREALARDMPILAICRGVQELNVALGGTLHQQVHTLDARHDHRSGDGDLVRKFRPQHGLALCGQLAAIIGTDRITVNSLHEQAIATPAPGLVVEATAEDGTIEAVRAPAATFAIGVQYHPEWNQAANPADLALFKAFGAACAAYRARSDQTPIARLETGYEGKAG